MLDVTVAYNRYKFLGEEFLTWLWFVIEKDQNLIKNFDQNFVALEVGNRIVFENRRKESEERITIKGDGASLEEGILALKKGALVTELNMVYRSSELRWQFTVKGESLNISSLNIPVTGLPESTEDIEGVVLEKIFLYDNILKPVKIIIWFWCRTWINRNQKKKYNKNSNKEKKPYLFTFEHCF